MNPDNDSTALYVGNRLEVTDGELEAYASQFCEGETSTNMGIYTKGNITVSGGKVTGSATQQKTVNGCNNNGISSDGVVSVTGNAQLLAQACNADVNYGLVMYDPDDTAELSSSNEVIIQGETSSFLDIEGDDEIVLNLDQRWAYTTVNYDGTGTQTKYKTSPATIPATAKYFKLIDTQPEPDPNPNPTPTPTPSDGNDKDKNKDADNENTQGSNSKNSENTYVNPLKWKYPQNQPESLVLPEQQGPICVAAFKLAIPKGYKEALSLNLLLHNKAGYDSKQKSLTIYIPDAYLKRGRTFALIGIDQYGKTHYFTDTDLKADSITINIEGFEGYAFDLIYKD